VVVIGYSFLVDRLPSPASLRRTVAEVFATADVHVGRMYEDGGGPPAAVSCTYLELEGGDFRWRVDVGAVAGPTEATFARELCRRFGICALLPTDGEQWRLLTTTEDRLITLDPTELAEDRYVETAD
jgi:hypothetical protein